MRVLTQSQLNEWLDELAERLRLVAPVDVQGRVLYRPVQEHEALAWGFERADMSPKTWTFAATEAILTVEQGPGTQIKDAPPPDPTVIFGVRPCDARAALAIDALFLGKEPRDGRYAQHRDVTTLIGLACPGMWESCFCTVVGGSPNGTKGLDILLTELDASDKGHTYAVQVLSSKGEGLMAGVPGEDRDVALPEPRLTEGLPKLSPSADWRAKFNDAYWKRLADRCLACRACTFVCPTCRCFDVRDEVAWRRAGLTVFERLRAWDACTSAPYRRIAGGHNPRPTPHSRLRNRFYCKFVYYPDDFGPLGCVGCGRCIDTCPVNIDILEVLSDVARLAAREPAEVSA